MSPGVMTLAVPIFDTFGDVQMVLQSPGMVDQVAREEARLASELLRTGSRLDDIFGVHRIRRRIATPAAVFRHPADARAKLRQPARRLALTGVGCALVICSVSRT